MYYYTTTSTLDINPETAVANPEKAAVNPDTTTVNSTSTPTTPGRGRRQTTAARIAALEQLILDNQDDPHLRRIDMAHILGVGLSRIKDDLRLLAAQGKVVFVGSGSHSGHWHLNGDPETAVGVEQWLQTPGYHLLHGSRGRAIKAKSAPKWGSKEMRRIAAYTALNCLVAAVETPFALREDIYRQPYYTTSKFGVRPLWRDAVSPLRPLLRRG